MIHVIAESWDTSTLEGTHNQSGMPNVREAQQACAPSKPLMRFLLRQALLLQV